MSVFQDVLDVTREELGRIGVDCLALAAAIRAPGSVESVIDTIVAKFGSQDILVSNAAG